MNDKFFTKKEIFPLLIILAVLIATIFLYPIIPARIPSHWNIYGQVDGYMGKKFFTIFFPVLVCAIYLLMSFLPLIDPLRKNIEKSKDAYFYLKTILVGFLSVIYFFSLYVGMESGKNIAVGKIVPTLLGFVFVAIGVLLPRIKRNYFMGIRTPWTLDSDEVWEETHKRGKWWFVLGGIVFIIGGLLNLGLMAYCGIIFLLAPLIDSYLIYKKLVKK
ncbi:MAG: SdpI family protein [bacterium]